MRFMRQYCDHICCYITQLSAILLLSNHQITQTFGVIALTYMEYRALSVCAEQMPIFPAALVHYDCYLSNWVAVTLLCLCWTWRPDWSPPLSESPGQGGWQLTENRETTATHQRAPIRLFWSIYDPCCFLGKLKKNKNPLKTVPILYAVFYRLQVQPGCCCCQERPWTEMSSTTFMLLLLFVPQTGAWEWVTPLVSYCRTNFEWREMAVKSFTNICNAIMLNYGWSTFA